MNSSLFTMKDFFIYIEWMRKIALYKNIKWISISEFVCKNQLQAVANNDQQVSLRNLLLWLMWCIIKCSPGPALLFIYPFFKLVISPTSPESTSPLNNIYIKNLRLDFRYGWHLNNTVVKANIFIFFFKETLKYQFLTVHLLIIRRTASVSFSRSPLFCVYVMVGHLLSAVITTLI